MFLYEKVILKNDKDFQKLSKKDKKNYLKILKHKHLALWLTSKFINSPYPLLFSLGLCFFNLILCIAHKNAIPLLFFMITFPIILFIVILETLISFKLRKQNSDVVTNWLFDFFMSFWLLNPKVLSKKDWNYIKKEDKEFYKYLRSDECNHRCYETTYDLANFLKDNSLKILWVSVSTPLEKVGHATLLKGNFIYDTNTRKTYSKDVYFQAFNVEVYNVFSFEDYSNQNFFSIHFDNFVAWCKNRGVIPFD